MYSFEGTFYIIKLFVQLAALHIDTHKYHINPAKHHQPPYPHKPVRNIHSFTCLSEKVAGD